MSKVPFHVSAVCLALCGCIATNDAEINRRRLTPKLEPDSQAKSLPGPGVDSTLVSLPPPGRTVHVFWENPKGVPRQYPFANRFFTGLEGSTNLTAWSEVVRMPFQPFCDVWLSNRPPSEFYRAVSGLK